MPLMTHRVGFRVAAALALALAAAPLPAQAQSRAPARGAPAAAEPPKPAPEPPAPPYERDLMRLSEIIGSLAFLRELCADPDAAEWPRRMRALLDAEATTPARRERFAGAYNRGYRGYALTYRVCTPSALEAATRFIAEGDRLTRTLAGRYGG
jgi:uncharacterized protein (TIGR02301 family)